MQVPLTRLYVHKPKEISIFQQTQIDIKSYMKQ
jgi:hypothetical protein